MADQNAVVLKNHLVVKDYAGYFYVWSKQKYERYIAGAISKGGGSAYKIILTFDGTEDFLNDKNDIHFKNPPSDGEGEIKKSLNFKP